MPKEIDVTALCADSLKNLKALADASGAAWSQVHYEVGGHLGRLIEYAHRMGWPMLSAIVVNKPNVSTGEMEA